MSNLEKNDSGWAAECRLYANTAPFYTRDLDILGVLEPIPADPGGRLYPAPQA